MGDLRIRTAGLSKRYYISGKRERYGTLRDSLVRATLAPCRRIGSAFRHSRLGPSDNPARSDPFWALKDVNLEVKRGDVVGIIGRNGAGKTTLLKVLSRITEPTEGYAEVHGRVGSLLEVGTGFHPELSGRENIYLNGAILGMRKEEIDRKFDEIVAFAEIERFIDTPVKHYSSGMYMRLAFSVAAHLEPEILLIDEVLAVGDAVFQNKCLGKMGDITKEGRTILFISHNMGAVRSLCNKGALLSGGRLIEAGEINKVIEQYYELMGSAQAAQGMAPGSGEAASSGFGPIILNGRPGNTLRQSQEFEVATSLNIDQEISGFTLYGILEDIHGGCIFHLREESTLLGYRDIAIGKHSIRVTLPPLWLNPGLYSLYFKVFFWGEYDAARYVSEKLLLDVVGTSSTTNAILHPKAAWSFDRAATFFTNGRPLEKLESEGSIG